MTVRYRRDREAWYVDVVVNHPDGTWERIRARSPSNTKRAAQEYERKLIEEALARAANPSPAERRFDEFAEDFMKTYATANNKPSEVDSKQRILNEHLLPNFGPLLLSQVTTYEVERYKAAKLSPPTAPASGRTTSGTDEETPRPRKPSSAGLAKAAAHARGVPVCRVRCADDLSKTLSAFAATQGVSTWQRIPLSQLI